MKIEEYVNVYLYYMYHGKIGRNVIKTPKVFFYKKDNGNYTFCTSSERHEKSNDGPFEEFNVKYEYFYDVMLDYCYNKSELRFIENYKATYTDRIGYDGYFEPETKEISFEADFAILTLEKDDDKYKLILKNKLDEKIELYQKTIEFYKNKKDSIDKEKIIEYLYQYEKI